MKKLLVAGFAGLYLVTGAGATTFPYFENFGGFNPLGSDVDGQGGWSINYKTADYDQYSVVGSFYGHAIALGGAAQTMPTIGTTVSLSHSYVGGIGGLKMQFDYLIADSDSGYDPTLNNRDKFGVSLTVGGTELLGIVFSPKIPNPTDPTSDTVAYWDASYTSAYGTGELNMRFVKNGVYTFSLECAPANAGASTSFVLEVSSSNPIDPHQIDGATLTGLNPNTLSNEVNINWSNSPAQAFGSNYIIVDNLAMLPEPSSSMMVCLAGIGLAVRRRRA